MRSRVYVTVQCPSVWLSVCLSHRSTAGAACGWFAAERPANRRYPWTVAGALRRLSAGANARQQRRRSTALGSKCGQRHVDSHRRKPHSGLLYTHAHPFNGPLSGTTRVSRYQKGKTNLDFTEARDSEWQRHQLGHMQVCTSL